MDSKILKASLKPFKLSVWDISIDFWNGHIYKASDDSISILSLYYDYLNNKALWCNGVAVKIVYCDKYLYFNKASFCLLGLREMSELDWLENGF